MAEDSNLANCGASVVRFKREAARPGSTLGSNIGHFENFVGFPQLLQENHMT
jgi:hypothetical protein